MKPMTTKEKFDLIRSHGDHLSRTGRGAPMDRRSDILWTAQRIVELAKSIPKSEWGVEQ